MNRMMRHKLKKLVILNSLILIVSSIALFTCIYTNVSSRRQQREHDKWNYFIFELIVIVTSMINAIVGLALTMRERRKSQDHQKNWKSLDLSHLIVNIICTSLFSFIFINEFIRWYTHLLNDDQIRNSYRLVVILFALLIGLSQIACIIDNLALGWNPHYHYSRLVLCFSSILLTGMAIASIRFNTHRSIKANDSVPHWCYRTLQVSSSYALICGLAGIALSFANRRKESGKNQFRLRLWQVFNVFCAIGLLLVIIFTIIFWTYQRRSQSLHIETLTHANLLLFIVQCILLLLSMSSLYKLACTMRSSQRGLTIERIRLSESLPAYITHWAAAIDMFNDAPEGMTGEAVLQLMKAYENGQLENVECLVSRIGRPNRRIFIADSLWDDTEALLLLTVVHRYDAMCTAQFNGAWGTVLKRTLGTENCTERFRPLLLRIGLIGFQWPFRTSIFFTAHHHDPLTRAANVLRTIVDWNEMQKSTLRSDVLLLPTLSTELTAKAIPLVGFFSLHFPPTHLLDLRSHHGKTWSEYMKTLKKDNRRPYIQQFLNKGGTIEEVHDLNRSDIGKTICEQWANTARLRQEQNQPSTLARPSVEFISSMGHAMSGPYRSVLLLRFDNEVIASGVIYKFPHKLLTIDITGLTHEKARPHKAYFVMLHWTIKEALDKGFDFVDFGPTAPGPKMDLGCTSVPSEVGGYARNPIFALGIQQAGSALDSIHKASDHRLWNASTQDVTREDKSALHTLLPTNNNDAPSRRSLKRQQKQLKNMKKSTTVNDLPTSVLI